MNDPEKVRAALEPHGYGWTGPNGDGAITFFWPPGHRSSDYTSRGVGHHLARFLNDRSQTGARAEDLIRRSPSDNIAVGEWALRDGRTFDDIIAQTWLEDHGLADPRKEAT